MVEKVITNRPARIITSEILPVKLGKRRLQIQIMPKSTRQVRKIGATEVPLDGKSKNARRENELENSKRRLRRKLEWKLKRNVEIRS